ncbi:MAG: HAD family phosphatase [Clostridiales bacterium]|nr:HAD family phosphatase [Clostridiales bacterium]
MIKACIFDFDGVIVDSEKYHHLGWVWVAEELGVELSYEEYAPFKSAGRAKVIPYLFEKAGKAMQEGDFDKYSRIREEKIATAIAKLNENDVMPGVVEFVKLLKANGIKVAVASASASSNRVAKRFGLYELFDAFVDGEAKLAAKPNPDIFLHAAHLLGVAPHECVVFEDSINGILAAKNAQMKCVGFQTYFCNKADKIIDSFVGADLGLLEF